MREKMWETNFIHPPGDFLLKLRLKHFSVWNQNQQQCLYLIFPRFKCVYFTKTICSNFISEVLMSPILLFQVSVQLQAQVCIFLMSLWDFMRSLWASSLVQGQNFSWVQWKQINPGAGKLQHALRMCVFWGYWEKQKQGWEKRFFSLPITQCFVYNHSKLLFECGFPPFPPPLGGSQPWIPAGPSSGSWVGCLIPVGHSLG